MPFTYLNSSETNDPGVFKWAKKLVQDLNTFTELQQVRASIVGVGQTATTAAENAELAALAAAVANNAAASVTATTATLAVPGYIVDALSAALANERVLTGATGVTIDFTIPHVARVVVNVSTALGFTPANKAGDTFTGLLQTADAKITNSLELDIAETAAAVISDHWVPVTINGTVRKLLLAS